MTTVQNLPVFEPLTKATKNKLLPLEHLSNQSFLEIWVDEDQESFIFRPGYFGRIRDVNDPMSPTGEPYKTRRGTEVYRLSQYTNREFKQFLVLLPEADELDKKAKTAKRYNEWKVANTDTNILITYLKVGMDRIIFRGKQSETMFRYTLARFLNQSKRAKLQADFKLNNILPEMPPEYIEHKTMPLSDYQKAALAFAYKQEGSAFFMQQGTGKTPVAVNLVCAESALCKAGLLNGPKPHVMKVLVVCPKQVRLNWQNEFKSFATRSGRVTIIKGTQEKRMRLIVEGLKNNPSEPDDAQSDYFRVLIVGYDTLSRDRQLFQLVKGWDRIICDESHYFKNPETNRWKDALEPFRDDFHMRLALTGSPIGNTANDLFSQLEFLGEGLSGFSNFKHFKSFFNSYEVTNVTASYKKENWLGNRNIPFLQERLARLAFSITKDEAGLKLPDKVYNIWEVEMTKAQKKVYDQMAAHLKVAIENALDSTINRAMTVNNVLTQLLRLAQITSGFVTWDAEFSDGEEPGIEQIDSDEENPKMQGVLEILDEDAHESPNSKTIIWATFKEDIKLIERVLTSKGIKCGSYYGATSEKRRDEVVHLFNHDPEFKVIICNAKTAGEGLNLLGYNYKEKDTEKILPTYCGREIFFSQNWSMIERVQAEDRAHRRGAKMPVQITDLTIAGTIDEEIRARVATKSEAASAIQNTESVLKSVLSGINSAE